MSEKLSCLMSDNKVLSAAWSDDLQKAIKHYKSHSFDNVSVVEYRYTTEQGKVLKSDTPEGLWILMGY